MASERDTPISPMGPASHRPASMTLRASSRGETDATQLDPANQSLAEALGLIFRVLQFAMLALFVAFAFSGFQSIKENERGIRLLFGRVTGSDLPSGFRFSAPYPMGEVVKVDVGNTGLNLDESFWPRLTDEQKRLSMEQLALQGKASLKPGEDGSLLTGDQNIAHARWSVIYTRKSPRNYSENVLSEDEKRIVQGAVERGIVQAVAQVKIDDLLKQSASDEGSVATRAKEIAQSTLNAINSGISIDQLTLKEKAPPFSVYNDFSRVQSAQQAASGKREEANSTARNTLNAMAGSAHAPLITKIDEYEQALARNDAAAKDTLLAEIFGILDGKAVAGEKGVPAGAVSGQVTYLLNNAKQYRSSIVSQRQGELASFKAKLAQFKTNPDVVVQREWADAMTAFLARPMVEIFNLPPGSRVVELWLNRDPDFLKDYQEAAKRKKVEDAEERRRLEQLREIFRTRTDAVEVQTR